MKKVLFILISLVSLKYTSTATCPLQIRCDKNKNTDICRSYETFGDVITISAKRCPDGKTCKGTDYEALCVPNEGNLPGDRCEEDKQCLSKKCDLLVCAGFKEGYSCSKDEDCDVGLYCSEKYPNQNKCVQQKGTYSECSKDEECKNNAGCFNKLCTKYLSLPIGTNVYEEKNKLYCSSNLVFQYGQGFLCAKSEMKSEFLECPGNVEYCNYTYNIGTSQDFPYQLPCSCSYTYPSKKFCPLASQNSTYIEGIKAYQDHFNDDAKTLHSKKRFNIKSHTKNKKYTYAKTFPYFYGAPECLFEALLSADIVKTRLFGFLILGLLL